MNDRAEQAKALIERATNPRTHDDDSDHCSACFGACGAFGGDWVEDAKDLVTELTAALSASEAEVTRLETGIAEALAITETMRGDEGPNNFIRKANDAFGILERLSQPTTDTNGAYA